MPAAETKEKGSVGDKAAEAAGEKTGGGKDYSKEMGWYNYLKKKGKLGELEDELKTEGADMGKLSKRLRSRYRRVKANKMLKYGAIGAGLAAGLYFGLPYLK